MRLAHLALPLSAAAVFGCSGGGGTGASSGAGGEGTSTSASSSAATTTSSSSATTGPSSSSISSSGAGGGGATSTTASSSSGSTNCATLYQPSGFTCSGTTPSLTNDVAPITTANCSASTCHSAMNSGTGVRNELVGIIAEECNDERLLINPGNPECSYAIHKLTGTNESGCSPMTTMPLGKSMLPASHIQTVYDWICAGAPNN